MATNNKRREATRRQLEQQLQERQRREAARKRTVLIASIAGTLVVIAAVVVGVILVNRHDNTSNQAGGAAKTPSPTVSAPTTSQAPTTASKPCKVTHPAGSVLFDGVTVANPTNLAKNPDTTSCSKVVPKTLEVKDLVVGKGAAASPTSTVSVQYAGVLYKDGTAFDSSWARGGQPASFPLTGVVKGFTYGIGGMGKIAPMKVGGRRIIIVPANLGYGSQASGAIPANSPLVFVVDLKSVK